MDVVLEAAEVPAPGELTRVGDAVVVNVDGTLQAFLDECPHDGCAFSEDGVLEGEELVCECHGSRFDVRTGRLLTGPAYEDAAVCAVTPAGDGYVVSLPD